MSRIRLAAPTAFALALVLATGHAVAQQPAPPAAQPAQPAPAEPAPAQPAPAPAAPAQAAPGEQMPPPAPPTGTMGTPSPLQPGDAFGQEVSLPERTIIYIKGHTNWDTAFDTLVDSFKSLNDYLDKQGIKADGLPMTIYTQTDDTGFQFEAAMPVAEAPKDPPKGDIAVGKAPTGKALKFVHRGSYDAMDSTYEAITNYLDDKQLEAKDLFIEEYTTSPVTSNPDKLVINVFVPVK
ncbi:MAG TPA: GyrI-like domain-containing protein [Pseudolabrys sp.]|jgi:effector-binding domain-containing protein|nr:GyrI-like domain-containing protein [Pseudolabrys sp.]